MQGRSNDSHELSLTAAQEGIWRGQQLDSSSPLYNVAECTEIVGPIEIVALTQAIRRAISEVEVFGMHFGERDGRPFQRAASLRDVAAIEAMFPAVESLTSADDPWPELRRVFTDDLDTVVDLANGPLWISRLLRADERRHFWYLRCHHILLDGAGFSALRARVAGLYRARIEGREPSPSPFDPLSAALAEEAEYVASPRYDVDRRFWHQFLRDRPCAAGLGERSARAVRMPLRRMVDVGRASTDALRSYARQSQLGWPDVAIACVAAYVRDRRSCVEPVLGLPVMGRMGSAASGVPVMTMNILPLRVPISDGDDVGAVARVVAEHRRHVSGAGGYRYETLRREHGALAAERRLFGPVVNVLPFPRRVVFGEAIGHVHAIASGPVEDVAVAVRANLDGSSMQLQIEANPDACSNGELDEHAQAIVQRLDAVGRQRASVRRQPPATTVDVVAAILRHVETRADAVAVEDGTDCWSYGELYRDAGRLARRLGDAGVERGDLVALVLPRGYKAIVAMLAVMLRGAAYLPIEPQGPVERSKALLAQAQPAAWIITSADRRLVAAWRDESLRSPDQTTPVVWVDEHGDGHESGELASVDGVAEVSADTPAYVIYTSGSTGRPNGVVIGRGALSHFASAAADRYGWGPGDRILQFASLSFDASVEEVFVGLTVGATLVIRPADGLESLSRLIELTTTRKLTVLDLPTALWHELTTFVADRGLPLPRSLRQVIIGGEAAAPEMVRRWRESVGSSPQLLNTYGPTEATVVALVADLSQERLSGAQTCVPIGRPLGGVGLAVLGPDGTPVPDGEPGELVLTGPALARGYIDRPAANATRFVMVQIDGEPVRGYRTGDRVRRRSDGQFVFEGRVDDECKINGFRVDPAEVEAVLRRCEGVTHAAVVVDTAAKRPRLVGYVVATTDLVTQDVRSWMGRHLLAAAVPSHLVQLSALPTNHAGKIDRGALRQLASAVDKSSSVAVPRRLSALAAAVHDTLCEALEVDRIELHDDFFAVGGDSIRALRACSRLSTALAREVPVTLLLDHPTVAKLEAALDCVRKRGEVSQPKWQQLAADAVLPDELVPLPGAPGDRGHVLLTGATGFVGAHLLAALLAAHSRRVTCLVRASGDNDAARRRLTLALSEHNLCTPTLAAAVAQRVDVIAADLSAHHFGLPPERYVALARACDVIVHAAADVNLARGYDSVKRVNVDATRALIDFASTEVPKAIHYLSTLAVVPDRNAASVSPESFVAEHEGLRDGYVQSKWVSECLLEKAAQRGFPVSVVRLGRVAGAVTGSGHNPDDLFWRVVVTGLDVGALPSLDVAEVWTPVDYVAAAIVHLIDTRRCDGSVFNVAPTEPVRWRAVFEAIRRHGFQFELCSSSEWATRVRTVAPNAAHVAGLFDSIVSTPSRLGVDRVENRRFVWSMASSDLIAPPNDARLVRTYLDRLIDAGLISAPPPSRHDRQG